jgi:cytidylate kinase
MIKLFDLLLEAVNGKPIAVFLAGSPGAGKSHISKQIIPTSYTSINVDDEYEELLKKNGLGLKQKDFGADQNKLAGTLQAQARKATQDKLNDKQSKKQNIVIDSVAGASGPVQKKKDELEALGYDCVMVMVYASPLTSLERNSQRDRSLMPGIVMKSWHAVNTLIDTYKKMFGPNFYIVNNETGKDTSFSKDKLDVYFKDTNPNPGAKVKTPEEIAKSKAEKEKMYKEIETMSKQIPKFDSIDTVKAKLNNG